MKVVIRTANGAADEYEQSDPALAREMLDQIRPPDFFDSTMIAIEQDSGVRLYPKESVVRIDFDAPSLPNWAMLNAGTVIQEIEAAEFHAAYKPMWQDDLARGGQLDPGDTYRGFVILTLIDGSRIYLRNESPVGRKIDERLLSSRAFATVSFFFRNLRGGNAIVNRRHVSRLDLLPGRPDLAVPAWKMESTQ